MTNRKFFGDKEVPKSDDNDTTPKADVIKVTFKLSPKKQ